MHGKDLNTEMFDINTMSTLGLLTQGADLIAPMDLLLLPKFSGLNETTYQHGNGHT